MVSVEEAAESGFRLFFRQSCAKAAASKRPNAATATTGKWSTRRETCATRGAAVNSGAADPMIYDDIR